MAEKLGIYDFIDLPPILDKNKPVKLFEAFAGYGSQQMALKRLGVDIKVVGYSEIDKYAIQVYEALHGKHKNYGGIGSFDKLPVCDIATWSFPCQNISNAGNQKGMVEGTKSNYGYVFLDTVKATPYEERPKVLLMENVKNLMSKKFEIDMMRIKQKLESMGYSNYIGVLNSKDYGVAQSRDRVFIVSIKDGATYTETYEFPKRQKLDKFLKDYLEEDVNEKYYLNEKQVKQIKSWNSQQNPLENARVIGDKTLQTITAKSNTSMNASMILLLEPIIIDTKSSDKFRRSPKIKIMPTIMTDTRYNVLEPAKNESIKTSNRGTLWADNILYWVRKITPREALRLMDVSESDIDIILSEVSNTQAYKLAGNSIVVNVLVGIFKQLF